MRRLALLTALLSALASPAASASASTLPPVKHVYVIVLENEDAATAFGPGSPAPYLSQTLRSEGAYLPNYYAIGHNSLPNYIAMISGQAPNPYTEGDCSTYEDTSSTSPAPYGQFSGAHCVYPSGVPTLLDQLSSRSLTWRAYNGDMGADSSRESAACGHPPLNGPDNTHTATPADSYAARHDPFVYFHSIIDDASLCDSHVLNLDALGGDLANPPNYTFISPSLCDDGHDSPCANGDPGGLPQADAFLQQWVPRITGSPAFKRDGLLVITFDETASNSGSGSDACCGEIPGPDSSQPGMSGPGGGDVGAVLLSPYIAPGTVSSTPYNHYSLLRSVEDLFGLGHLGYAQLPGEASFGSDIFKAAQPPACQASQPPIHGARITRRHHRVTLSFYSTGSARLRIVIRRHGHRREIKGVLVACRGYSIRLPRGHHRVRIIAGTQRLRRKY